MVNLTEFKEVLGRFKEFRILWEASNPGDHCEYVVLFCRCDGIPHAYRFASNPNDPKIRSSKWDLYSLNVSQELFHTIGEVYMQPNVLEILLRQAEEATR